MKFKRLIASIVSASIAVTSFAVSTISTVNADTPAPVAAYEEITSKTLFEGTQVMDYTGLTFETGKDLFEHELTDVYSTFRITYSLDEKTVNSVVGDDLWKFQQILAIKFQETTNYTGSWDNTANGWGNDDKLTIMKGYDNPWGDPPIAANTNYTCDIPTEELVKNYKALSGYVDGSNVKIMIQFGQIESTVTKIELVDPKFVAYEIETRTSEFDEGGTINYYNFDMTTNDDYRIVVNCSATDPEEEYPTILWQLADDNTNGGDNCYISQLITQAATNEEHSVTIGELKAKYEDSVGQPLTSSTRLRLAFWNSGTADTSIKIIKSKTNTVPMTDITLSKTAVVMEPTDVEEITVAEVPSFSTESLTVTSDKPEIAKAAYDAGTNKIIITGVATGTAKITVKANDTLSKDIAVTVQTMQFNETAKIYKGKTATTGLIVNPELPDGVLVNYSSDNEKVATVNENGVITAVGAGTTKIKVTANGQSKECDVEVKEPKIEAGNLTISPGSTAKINASVTGLFDGDTADYTYKSSDENVATVDKDGIVTASAGEGTRNATITISVKVGDTEVATKDIDITVSDNIIKATSIKLKESDGKDASDNYAYDNLPAPAKFLVEVSPLGVNEAINVTSSNPDVATVSVDWANSTAGVGLSSAVMTVEFKGFGSTKIEVTGAAANASLTVQVNEIKADSISMKENLPATIEIGTELDLSPTILPANTYNKNITYTSSDTSIVNVSDAGKIKALAAGKAEITAKTANGKTATYNVTVTAPVVNVTGITLNKTAEELTVDKTLTLTATVAPEDATDKSFTWSTSNASVATVNNGVVTAVAVGTATITVTTTDGSKTATCEITVKEKPVGVTVYEFSTDEIAKLKNGDLTINVVYDNPTGKENWENLSFGASVGADWKSLIVASPLEGENIYKSSVADLLKAMGIDDASAITYFKTEGYNGALINSVEFIENGAETDEDYADGITVAVKAYHQDTTDWLWGDSGDTEVVVTKDGAKINFNWEMSKIPSTSLGNFGIQIYCGEDMSIVGKKLGVEINNAKIGGQTVKFESKDYTIVPNYNKTACEIMIVGTLPEGMTIDTLKASTFTAEIIVKSSKATSGDNDNDDDNDDDNDNIFIPIGGNTTDDSTSDETDDEDSDDADETDDVDNDSDDEIVDDEEDDDVYDEEEDGVDEDETDTVDNSNGVTIAEDKIVDLNNVDIAAKKDTISNEAGITVSDAIAEKVTSIVKVTAADIANSNGKVYVGNPGEYVVIIGIDSNGNQYIAAVVQISEDGSLPFSFNDGASEYVFMLSTTALSDTELDSMGIASAPTASGDANPGTGAGSVANACGIVFAAAAVLLAASGIKKERKK